MVETGSNSHIQVPIVVTVGGYLAQVNTQSILKEDHLAARTLPRSLVCQAATLGRCNVKVSCYLRLFNYGFTSAPTASIRPHKLFSVFDRATVCAVFVNTMGVSVCQW